MATLQQLQQFNPALRLHSVNSEAFVPYGRVLEGYDWKALLEELRGRNVPEDGNIYVASDEAMERMNIKAELEARHYGGMPVQIGYCNGRNSHLNGLEYHKCSEINVAADDLVLLLGKVQEIRSNRYAAEEQVEAFFIPQGTAIEIYSTTLHFAPCKTKDEGFRCIVVLTAGTNTPFERPVVSGNDEDKLLFMRNKWLLAHPERRPLIEKGAFPGIIGSNFNVIYKDEEDNRNG
jgi:hypothetical protein